MVEIKPAETLRLTDPRSGRYAHIDALRAFAVMLVVVAHAGLGHIVPGGSGVTIFFAISGFIITHLVLKEHAKTGGFNVAGFYLRRVLKLAPPFLVIVALPTAIYALWHPVNIKDFLAQVFFMFNWVYMTGDYDVLPGSAVVWSLAVEEQFYIGFALLWVVLVQFRRRLILLGSVAASVAVASLLMRVYIAETAFSHNRIYYGTDTRIDGIALGVFSAVVYFWLERAGTRGALVRSVLGSNCMVVLAVGSYLLSLIYRDEYFRETYRYTIQASAASLLVLYGLLQTGTVVRRLMQSVADLRLVQCIGLASYSIYLIHLSLNSLLHGLVMGWPKPLAVLALSTLGVLAGLLVWRLVEVPVENYKRRRNLGVGAAPIAVPAQARA